jgi:chromosome segregation ATPase
VNSHQWDRSKAIIIEAYERHATNNYDSPDGLLATHARIAVREVERFQTNYRAAYDERAQLRTELAQVAAERDEAATLNAQLRAALAESEQRRKPHTIGEDEYRVLWRMAEANLRQAAADHDKVAAERDAALAKVERLSVLDAGHMEEIHGLDQRVNDLDREHGRLTAERDAALGEVERLEVALAGLAMRVFTVDGSFCWCDGAVTDPAQWQHEPACADAREAMDDSTRLGESRK